MAHFLRQRERVTVTHYSYDVTNKFGSGWSFQTTPEQDVILDWQNVDIQAASWLAAQEAIKAGTHTFFYASWETSYVEPASIACVDCSAEVFLGDGLFNECQCGAGYNGCGQRLAPVSQWDRADYYDTFGPRDDPEDLLW